MNSFSKWLCNALTLFMEFWDWSPPPAVDGGHRDLRHVSPGWTWLSALDQGPTVIDAISQLAGFSLSWFYYLPWYRQMSRSKSLFNWRHFSRDIKFLQTRNEGEIVYLTTHFAHSAGLWALARMVNGSVSPVWRIDPTAPHTMSGRSTSYPSVLFANRNWKTNKKLILYLKTV